MHRVTLDQSLPPDPAPKFNFFSHKTTKNTCSAILIRTLHKSNEVKSLQGLSSLYIPRDGQALLITWLVLTLRGLWEAEVHLAQVLTGCHTLVLSTQQLSISDVSWELAGTTAIGENRHFYDNSFHFESICTYIVSFELQNHSVIRRESPILTLQKRKQTQGSEMTARIA